MLPKTLLVGFSSKAGVSGLGVQFDLVLAGFTERQLPFLVVDFSRLGQTARAGAFTWHRALATMLLLIEAWLKLLQSDRVLMTIAPSRSGFLRDIFLIWPSRLLGRRLILKAQSGGYGIFLDSQPRWLKSFICLSWAQADTLIVEGKLLGAQFEQVPGLPSKIQVVPNGLPVGLSSTSISPRSLSRDMPMRLLYLSNMVESKGYLDVLAACRILHHERTLPIHCDFCGDFVRTVVDATRITGDQAKTNFHDLIHSWQMNEVVTYHGVVTGDQKERLLHQAHVLILPTSYPWEGQPVSIVEALAYGIPVVTTPFRGIPEQVIDGYNGVMVEPGNPSQIADAVQRLWSDPESYQQMRLAAQKHFEENFTQKAFLDRLIPIILTG